jgi:hypothetical protein
MDSLLSLLQMTLSLLSLLNSSSTIQSDVRLQISQVTTRALTLIEQVDPTLIDIITTTTVPTIPTPETVATSTELASSTASSSEALSSTTTMKKATSTEVELSPKDFRAGNIIQRTKTKKDLNIKTIKFYSDEKGFLHQFEY